MTIRNKYLIWLVVRVLNLKPYKVDFHYLRETYDKDITKLGFLNQVKVHFNENVDDFNRQLDEEIEKALKNPEDW